MLRSELSFAWLRNLAKLASIGKFEMKINLAHNFNLNMIIEIRHEIKPHCERNSQSRGGSSPKSDHG